MASLMLQNLCKSSKNVRQKYSPLYTVIRNSSVPPRKKDKRGTVRHRNLIQSSCESLAARGFLRSYKPYTPPENVCGQVTSICERVLGSNHNTESDLSKEEKFSLLNMCYEKFDHSVPNSFLHKIVNVQDVIDFYETPVSTTVPYDELVNQDLPPNLHIQKDYIRFNPDTDTKFKGITAFPRSSTIVTGLKYKEKYKGHQQKPPFKDCHVHYKKKL